MSTKLTAKDLDIKNPKAGVYFNVPDSIYFATEAINNSLLKILKDKSPAHFHYQKRTGQLSFSKSKDLGSICHVRLLQPDRLEDEVKILPEGSANSHAYKYALADMFPEAGIDKSDNKDVWREKVERSYPDKVLTDPATLAKSKNMIEKLYAHDDAYGDGRLAMIMEDSETYTEVVVIWRDKETGLLLKCKFDILNLKYGLGLDYKTTADASPEKFKYTNSDYGYYRALEFYDQGAEANGIELANNSLLVQETEEPYVHYWAQLEEEERRIAQAEIRYYLRQLAECMETETWRPWTGKDGRNVLSLKLRWSDYNNEAIAKDLQS